MVSDSYVLNGGGHSLVLIEKNITSNGVYNASSDDADGYYKVSVSVDDSSSIQGEFLVQVIDYDGTILKIGRYNEGGTFTLPEQPSHSGLTFQGWSSPVTITNNTVTVTNSDITIGAVYTTSSGLSEFDITLTNATGLTVTLNMNGTKNWGDGTTDTNTSHIYSSTGDYTITCNGDTITSNIFGSEDTYYCTAIRLSSSVTAIPTDCFSYAWSLRTISMPNSITSIGEYAFDYCVSLISCVIPTGVPTLDSTFYSCYNLVSVAIPAGTNVIDACFSQCYSLKSVTLPEGCQPMYTDDTMFDNCHALEGITIPSTMTTIMSGANVPFDKCYSLKRLTLSEGVTDIYMVSFESCYSLTKIIMPSTIANIGDQAFFDCYSITEYDFSKCTSIPTVGSSAFGEVGSQWGGNINSICKIKVPASLYSSWIAATNWSMYADFIVAV